MTLVGDLADRFVLKLWRVSLMAHWTPLDSSMLASKVSTVLGEVHSLNQTVRGKGLESQTGYTPVLRTTPTPSPPDEDNVNV